MDFGGCQGHDLIESEDDGGGDGWRGSWSEGQHPEGEKVPAVRVDCGSLKVDPAATPLPKKSVHILEGKTNTLVTSTQLLHSGKSNSTFIDRFVKMKMF